MDKNPFDHNGPVVRQNTLSDSRRTINEEWTVLEKYQGVEYGNESGFAFPPPNKPKKSARIKVSSETSSKHLLHILF